MTMRTLTTGFVLAALVLAGILADARAAGAQDVQITGPLAGAPACRHCRIYRQGRIQLQPFVAFTLQDEFTRTIPIGLQAQYHLTDWLGIGVWGAWGGVSIDTGLTDQVQAQGQTTPRNRLSLPGADGFPDQIGRLNLFAGAHLAFIPLRGKLSLFQKLFIDTDLYIFLGAAGVQVEERADVLNPNICSRTAATTSPECLNTQSARATRFAIAPTFGVGLMLYASDFFGVSFEWRGLPFAWNTSGTDEGSTDNEFPDGIIDENDRIFHFNHMVVIGFAFYLPTKVATSE
jgi:outer membrane beta-barrel protein